MTVEMARTNLEGPPANMKKMYDHQAKRSEFSLRDQVLAQAKFAGPHTIERQVSDQNHLIATPNQRKLNCVMSTCLNHTMLE